MHITSSGEGLGLKVIMIIMIIYFMVKAMKGIYQKMSKFIAAKSPKKAFIYIGMLMGCSRDERVMFSRCT